MMMMMMIFIFLMYSINNVTVEATCYSSPGVVVNSCTCHETCVGTSTLTFSQSQDTEPKKHTDCGYTSNPSTQDDCITCQDNLTLTPLYDDGTGVCVTPGTCDTQIQTYARYTCNSNNEIVQEIFWDSNCSTPCSTWTWSMNATPNYDMNSFEALAHDFASPSICDSSLRGLRCVNGDVHVACMNQRGFVGT